MLINNLLFISSFIIHLSLSSRNWNEQDEADRISLIISEEKRQFDEEMKRQQQARYKSEYRSNYGGDYDNQDEFDRRMRHKGRGRTTTPTYERESIEEIEDKSDNWCYFCASPLNQLSSNSRKAVQQFLDIRRTNFPKDAVSRECNSPRNFTLLKKQECKHKFCQTLVLMDHDEGASFVMRGCAEHFGALNKELLDSREDNTCLRLHDKLDIRECICKERKSCYAGRERSISSSHSIFISIISFMIYRLLL